ncbi:MAG: ribonuclease P protein component [Burkholderiaceae bacterium]|nr:ribonuclease P protein component [Burkholderiaceae bacterium]
MAAADPSLTKCAPENCYRFGPGRRLKSAADYAAIVRAPNGSSIRAARQYLSVTALLVSRDAGAVRFGVTVGRRNARRAVDRALVKRIVREACRQQASGFERGAAAAGLGIDVALRLKSSLIDTQGRPLAMTQWRRHLRAEANALLRHVLNRLPAKLLATGVLAEKSERS